MSLERLSLPSGTPAVIGSDDGASPHRGVVVLPDVFGLSPVFEGLAERLATDVAARVGALELFPGLEDVGLQDRLATAIPALEEERVLADAVALADALSTEPVALVGVCIGGMLAMRAAQTGRFDRTVSLYGMVHVPERWQGGGKGDALDAVRSTSTPVLALAGTEDEFIPAEHLDELEAAGADVHRIAGATHGFAHDPSRPNHDAAAAAQVWDAVHRFLERNGQ